jgi:hypothetical protein
MRDEMITAPFYKTIVHAIFRAIPNQWRLAEFAAEGSSVHSNALPALEANLVALKIRIFAIWAFHSGFPH